MRGRSLLPVIVALTLGVAGLAATAYMMLPATTPVRVASIGGPFTLTAADGTPVSDQSLKGHPYLLFFGYTHCPDVCPTSLFEMSEVFKAMGPKAPIKALFVTVDPDRDTPALLKDYMANFDPRIIGASGDAQATAAIEKAFRVYAKKVPGENGDYTFDHTAIVYLMDRDGRFVNALNLEKAPQDVAKELAAYL